MLGRLKGENLVAQFCPSQGKSKICIRILSRSSKHSLYVLIGARFLYTTLAAARIRPGSGGPRPVPSRRRGRVQNSGPEPRDGRQGHMMSRNVLPRFSRRHTAGGVACVASNIGLACAAYGIAALSPSYMRGFALASADFLDGCNTLQSCVRETNIHCAATPGS